MILIIDNYDSFTFNLVQAVGAMGFEVKVMRNDKYRIRDLEKLPVCAVIISPGPGEPQVAGLSMATIDYYKDKLPLLGVCLGHQALGASFGGEVVRAERLMHGKISPVFHREDELFKGVKTPFEAMRYHSLILKKETLIKNFRIIAETKEEEVMAIRHKTYTNLVGLQFHPESFFTKDGETILKNFLEAVK